MDLSYKTKNGWENISDKKKKDIMSFADRYIDYLNKAKTERLACEYAVSAAKAKGFCDISEKRELKPGDKVYVVNRDKNVLLAVIGKEDILDGINFVISHIDSPRLDIKQNPLYEDTDLALLKTHYYGGIKKYQWTAMPLSLIGVVFLKDGTKINVSIGEAEGDPVFCITDLLPHLAADQMQKKMGEAFKGEMLNILIGSMPADVKDNKFKTNILNILNEKYGMCEEDFLSAELEAVPNFAAKHIGFDKSLIGAYGQDDRVCAYTSLEAFFETENPERTAVCLHIDKEEIGSMGNSGMKSAFFEYAIALLIEKSKGAYNELWLKETLKNSACLSSDVAAGVDPVYQEVSELQNAAIIGHGTVIIKYTGARGKYDTSDANAEFVFKIRRLLNDANVTWQTAELGKTDVGGGGTIAQYIANLNVDVIDCGVALLSMHSPFEISSKADVYSAYEIYKAFYKNFK